MALIKDIFQFFVYWMLTYAFGVVYLCYFVVSYLFGRYKLDPLSQPEREIQPLCLSDPLYGHHKFIKTQGVKLHYVESGDINSKLVILIHGTPGFWFCWRNQIPILSQEFRVVAVDLRGCGDSECPTQNGSFSREVLVKDIIAIINSLGYGAAHIVCCETSGHIGWNLATNHPEMVSKLVLINSPHPVVIHYLFHVKSYYYFKYWYLLFLQIPLLPEVISSRDATSTWLKSVLEPTIRAKAISKQETDAYSYTFSRKDDWKGVLNHLRLIDIKPKSEKILPEAIRVSTLLLMGSSHPYFVTEAAFRSAEYAERITIRIVDDAGCNLQVTHAKKTNDELLKFLRGPRSSSVPKPMTTKSSSFVGRVFEAVNLPYSIKNTDMLSISNGLKEAAHNTLNSGVDLATTVWTLKKNKDLIC